MLCTHFAKNVFFAGRPGSLCADHAHPHPGYCVSTQSDHGQQPPLQPQLQAVSLLLIPKNLPGVDFFGPCILGVPELFGVSRT